MKHFVIMVEVNYISVGYAPKVYCSCFSCSGLGYSCHPSSSCISFSERVGDGTCRDVMRPSGTICRPAADICDHPERYNCRLTKSLVTIFYDHKSFNVVPSCNIKFNYTLQTPWNY